MVSLFLLSFSLYDVCLSLLGLCFIVVVLTLISLVLFLKNYIRWIRLSFDSIFAISLPRPKDFLTNSKHLNIWIFEMGCAVNEWYYWSFRGGLMYFLSK